MSNAAVFGKRKEPHTIIIAQGDRIRHFTVRPWMLALVGSVLAAMAVGYLLATSYLMLRDDVLNAAIARQARMQYAYEDRIAALRSQVDRITSYRLLDQQVMETKVAELINRQSALSKRTSRLAPILEKVEDSGIKPQAASLDPSRVPIPVLDDTSEDGRAVFRMQQPVRADLQQQASLTVPGEDLSPETPYIALKRLGSSLDTLETDQVSQVGALTRSVRQLRGQIVADANAAGLSVADPLKETKGTGGPFIPADGARAPDPFDLEIELLNRELDALDEVRNKVRAYPIDNPAPGYSITSGFGNRRDPLLNRSAFHAGIDFGVPSGTTVRATAAGTVIRAGRNGGYGNMVEIRHVDGLTTRYAHLSRILVKSGDKIDEGAAVGKSGTTGRSTGPHLHYEVRSNGKAVSPMTYMKAGTRLGEYL